MRTKQSLFELAPLTIFDHKGCAECYISVVRLLPLHGSRKLQYMKRLQLFL